MVIGARTFVMIVSAGALLAAAGGACAQTTHAPITLSSDPFASFSSAGTEQSRWNPQPTQKSLFWDQKGHWGLKLDLSQPVGRDMQLRDVQAGAYFHITPSIQVGGAVALGDSSALDHTTILPQPSQAPRVKLETNFKF